MYLFLISMKEVNEGYSQHAWLPLHCSRVLHTPRSPHLSEELRSKSCSRVPYSFFDGFKSSESAQES